jgi:hypothetical protein
VLLTNIFPALDALATYVTAATEDLIVFPTFESVGVALLLFAADAVAYCVDDTTQLFFRHREDCVLGEARWFLLL